MIMFDDTRANKCKGSMLFFFCFQPNLVHCSIITNNWSKKNKRKLHKVSLYVMDEVSSSQGTDLN